jgi:hypothetical protein
MRWQARSGAESSILLGTRLGRDKNSYAAYFFFPALNFARCARAIFRREAADTIRVGRFAFVYELPSFNCSTSQKPKARRQHVEADLPNSFSRSSTPTLWMPALLRCHESPSARNCN